MTPIFKRHTRDEWCGRLEKEGVPYSPVYDSSDALEQPQAAHLGLKSSAVHPTEGPFNTIRFPVNFDGQRLSEVLPPPTLGEHNQAVRNDPLWMGRSES